MSIDPNQAERNSLYLVVALSMIFMTLVLATQPLFLKGLGLERDNAGFINANIQVITELVDLLFVGYLGYLSDRFGRIPIMYYGFVLSAITAALTPFCLELGLLVGINGVAVFYGARILMSIGSTAVWPQLGTLTGDYSTREDRPMLLAKVGFMTAFGATLVYAVFMQLPKYIGLTLVMMIPAVTAVAGAWLTRHFLVEKAPLSREKTFPFKQVMALLRQEKELRLSFMAAFSSRNDMVIIGLFLMTWFIYFADLLPEVGHARAAARAGMVIGFIGLIILLSLPFWGWLIHNFGRVESLTLGMVLSGVGFTGMGLIMNPLSGWTYLPALFVGLGQAGCLLAPQTLALDLSPEDTRGSVMGAFNTVGCIGIIFFIQIGGFLFDMISPTAPFIFTGLANFMIMAYGLWVLRSDAHEVCRKEGQGCGLDLDVFEK
ncbi:MAG: MFS transporter [Magnetococcales bacterium]|nr:MFS transporter [Magnetococcales bacterium]MBF0148799.1 MFS transporter [Magnetococcales bacterium]MBF0173399.1 MFS transporter [Magnetococcales bacterium]MBF0346476.1 MFS transporter [Magnetococcales bacterium]MBF0629866.1 MFS transporter [Magnetococcales bacterium]